MRFMILTSEVIMLRFKAYYYNQPFRKRKLDEIKVKDEKQTLVYAPVGRPPKPIMS